MLPALVRVISPSLDLDVIKVMSATTARATPAVTPFLRYTSNLFMDLKRFDNLWNQITTLGLFGVPNSSLALLDWKTPGSVYTNVNSMSFTAGQGFTGNGSTSYLNTGVNASVLGSQNSQHVAVYQRLNSASASGVALCGGGTTTSLTQLLQNGAGKDFLTRSNQATSDTDTGGLNANGLYVMKSRTASGTCPSWINGVKKTAFTTVSAAPGAQPIYIGARNNNGTPDSFSTAQIGLFHGGLGLSDGQAQLAYQAFNRWIRAVNCP